MLRIVFVPVFIILLVYRHIGWALSIFVSAGVTDVLDGLIARRLRQKTLIGGVLDPLADKLLMIASILIFSMSRVGFHTAIPRWLMIVIICRDVFILLVAVIVTLMVGLRVLKPSPYGKASTVMQFLMILAVLIVNWQQVHIPQLQILFYATGLMTAFSGLHYLGRSLKEWPFQ